MTWLPSAHRRVAAAFEDLASRADAGLPSGDRLPGDTAGGGLAASLARAGIATAAYEVRSIEAGEAVGRGPEVLRRLAASRHELAGVAKKLVDGLAYPSTVFVSALAVTALLMGLGLPLPHGWLLTVGIVASAAALAIGWLVWRLRDPTRAPDRIPVIGPLVRVAGELPYLTALSILYGAGVPLRAAHRDAVTTARGAWLRKHLDAVTPALERGEGFATSLAAHGALTPETLRLVTDGERTGGLEDALRRAIERRRLELSASLGRIARIVGVLAYMAAAGSVLWIAVSFYGGMLTHGAR